MAARPGTTVGTRIAFPFLVVVDVEFPGETPTRNEVGARRTYDGARLLAIRTRDMFDAFFGEYADPFVVRVVDVRNYTVVFEHY